VLGSQWGNEVEGAMAFMPGIQGAKELRSREAKDHETMIFLGMTSGGAENFNSGPPSNRNPIQGPSVGAGSTPHQLQGSERRVDGFGLRVKSGDLESGGSEDNVEAANRLSGDVGSIEFSSRSRAYTIPEGEIDIQISDDSDTFEYPLGERMERLSSIDSLRGSSVEDLQGIDFSTRIQTKRIQEHEMAVEDGTDDEDEQDEDGDTNRDSGDINGISFSRRAVVSPKQLKTEPSNSRALAKTKLWESPDGFTGGREGFRLDQVFWTALLEGVNRSRRLRMLEERVCKHLNALRSQRGLVHCFAKWQSESRIFQGSQGGVEAGMAREIVYLKDALAVAENALSMHQNGNHVLGFRM